MIRKLEGTRNVQGCYVAKTKTQQICRSQVIDDSWWVWNSRMAARLNLWTSTFKVMDWFMKPGKENNICHDLNPRRSMDRSMRPNDPCRLREKIANSASCAGTKPRGSGSQNCRIWTCDQWLPHFLGINDGDIPVMVRRYSSSDKRANWFASLNAKDEHVLRHHRHGLQVGDMSQNKQSPSKNAEFWRCKSKQRWSQHLVLGKKSCPAGISTGRILKNELRVANVWTKQACNDMANTSSSQAVCWRVSRKAQAVSFSNLSAQELPSVRTGYWQRSFLPQWAFTLYMVKGWPRLLAKDFNKTHRSRLSRLAIHPFTDPDCQDWWYIQ